MSAVTASRESVRPRAAFVSSEVYRRSGFGDNHPLSIPRVGAVMELCAALGWLPDGGYEDSPQATPAQLARYHDPAYIAVVREIDARGGATAEERKQYGIGTRENPVFEDLYLRATTACGGSIRAAQIALAGGVGFNPAGGTHHGMRDRAHGFCYFNDPVMAILTLLEGGVESVLYADLDAHHGDGVEAAFAHDARVLTVSIHEEGRWPFTGAVGDRAKGYARNLPVPRGFNDAELAYLIDHAVLPLADRYGPEMVVVTCGADGLADDPLSAMKLTNVALWRAVERLVALTPGAVVLGGGGYNPWTVARCWSGLWAALNGWARPSRLPADAERILRALDSHLIEEEDREDWWCTTLEDAPGSGAVREEVVALPAQVLA